MLISVTGARFAAKARRESKEAHARHKLPWLQLVQKGVMCGWVGRGGRGISLGLPDQMCNDSGGVQHVGVLRCKGLDCLD